MGKLEQVQKKKNPNIFIKIILFFFFFNKCYLVFNIISFNILNDIISCRLLYLHFDNYMLEGWFEP